MHALTIVPVIIALGLAPASLAQGRKQSAKEIYKLALPSVVEVRTTVGHGSGFIISGDGLILTAAHVVTSSTQNGNTYQYAFQPQITVKLHDGTLLSAVPTNELTFDNIASDYALLKIEKSGLPSLKLGSWDDVDAGDEITSLGFPFSPPFLAPKPLLITGIVSAKFPLTYEVVPGRSATVNAIYFQGPMNRGLSGAPMIDNRTGAVVGIVTNRLVAVTNDLLKARATGTQGATIRLGDVDVGSSVIGLIDVLDNSLTTGMGAAWAIDHVRSSQLASPMKKPTPDKN